MPTRRQPPATRPVAPFLQEEAGHVPTGRCCSARAGGEYAPVPGVDALAGDIRPVAQDGPERE
ncbi:MAG: hypothetical protein HC884_17780 [Chloroflexaceae bacterium]|nr:hypothetical protein [Chloroflexaceae bacterium]